MEIGAQKLSLGCDWEYRDPDAEEQVCAHVCCLVRVLMSPHSLVILSPPSPPLSLVRPSPLVTPPFIPYG